MRFFKTLLLLMLCLVVLTHYMPLWLVALYIVVWAVLGIVHAERDYRIGQREYARACEEIERAFTAGCDASRPSPGADHPPHGGDKPRSSALPPLQPMPSAAGVHRRRLSDP